MRNADLKHKTFHAVIWAAVRIGTTNVFGFVLFLVLARILSPHDFGVFALATVVVEIARIVSTAGLGDAVTRDQNADEILADTAFWANLGLGCLVGVAAWILAPIYAAFVDEPAIVAILRWLAVLVPVSALSGIHIARKSREFGHKAIAARTIFCNLVAGIAAVSAAIAGLGVWSLVIQSAISETAGVVFAWLTFPWRPRLRFDAGRLAAIGGFSGTMMLTQVMGLLVTRVQDVVIGRFISVSAVGGFRVAWRMIDLIAQATIQPIVSVSFITLSHLQNDPARLRAALLRMLGLGACFTLPAMAGFGVLSDDIIVLLFGAKWLASAGIGKVLTLMAVPFCLNYFLFSALAAIGRPAAMAMSTLLQTAVAILLSLIAARFGVLWVAAAYVLRAYLILPYHLLLFKRDTGIGIAAMTRAIAPPFLAAQTMAVVLLATAPLLRHLLQPGFVSLAVAVLLGCAVYIGLLLVFAPRYVQSNVGVLLPLCKGREPDVATR